MLTGRLGRSRPVLHWLPRVGTVLPRVLVLFSSDPLAPATGGPRSKNAEAARNQRRVASLMASGGQASRRLVASLDNSPE